MKTIAIVNQKGGVGKSTTTLAVGAGLILRGYKVLLVDLDAQGNLTYTMGGNAKGYNAFGVLQRSETVLNEIQHTPCGDLIASSAMLAGADTSITATGKEYRLREALEKVSDLYDYCIIDTLPSLGILTINALTASYGVIIPALADMYSLQGITQLYSTIQTVKRYCNPPLSVVGILLTHFTQRSILKREIAEMLEETAKQLNTKLFKSKIRECQALTEAQAKRTTIYNYAPKSNGAADYQALIEEILEKE